MKTVKLSDLFELKYGVNLEFYKMTLDKKGVNFVARGSDSNGIVGRVQKIAGIAPNPARSISVACSGSVMESFYQPEEYYSGRDIYYVTAKVEMSVRQKLFYCMVLRANAYRYNYGRQANKTLGDILIPAPEDLPAWVKTTSFPSPPSAEAANHQKLSLKDRNWKSFELEEVFKYRRGMRLKKIDRIKGKTHYFSASGFNNGLTDKISNPLFTKTSCLIYSTFGDAFYIKGVFTASDEISIFENKKMNSVSGMFLATILSYNKYKYSFGRKAFRKQWRNNKIKLPVDSNGNPDWQFMEDYIKSLPYSVNSAG